MKLEDVVWNCMLASGIWRLVMHARDFTVKRLFYYSYHLNAVICTSTGDMLLRQLLGHCQQTTLVFRQDPRYTG